MLNCLRILKLNDVLSNTSTAQIRLFHVSMLAQAFSHEMTQDNFKRKPKFTYKRKNYADNRSKTNDESFLHVKNFNPSSGSNSFKKFRLPKETLNETLSKEKRRSNGNGFIFGGRGDSLIGENAEGNHNDEDPESMLKHDEDLDLFIQDPELYHRKQIDDDINKRKQMKKAIIKKKLLKLEGRHETNFNLLTWDAKEQIKYLNLNEPELWTPEKIVESFPITLESCRKLLKSKWAPRSLDELAEHDRKAIENWQQLAKYNKIEPERGPAINTYEMYKSQNKLNMLKYATGIPGLEFERKNMLEEDSYQQHEKLLCAPGQFSQLVKRDDYVRKIFSGQDCSIEKNVNTKSESEAGNTNGSLHKKHLLMTKAELTKCLGNILGEKNQETSKNVPDKSHLKNRSKNYNIFAEKSQ